MGLLGDIWGHPEAIWVPCGRYLEVYRSHAGDQNGPKRTQRDPTVGQKRAQRDTRGPKGDPKDTFWKTLKNNWFFNAPKRRQHIFL